MPILSPNVLKLKAAIKGQRAIYTIEGHPGLYLHVRGDGGASWVVRYRVGGALKERVLSNDAGRADFSEITTTKDEIRLATKTKGVDLMAQRKADAESKAAAERAQKLTLGAVIDQWIAKPRKKELRTRTVKLYRSTFDAYVIPTFGKRPIADITKQELKTHFETLKKRLLKKGGRVTRAEVVGKAHTYLEAVFEYAVDEGYITISPMRGLTRPVPKEPERRSSRPLLPSELRAVWQRADVHLSPVFARAIKLALLLGRRRAEIAGARADEFHLDGPSPHWIIPPREGNKSALPSLVPLPRLALSVVREAIADGSPYLFPQSRGAEARPIAPDSLTHAWCVLRDAVGVSSDVNLHDARSLLTDALEKMGVPDNIVSHCLHHTSDMKGTTAKRVYSTNQFHDEKLRALRLWDLRLRGLVSGRAHHRISWTPIRMRSSRSPEKWSLQTSAHLQPIDKPHLPNL